MTRVAAGRPDRRASGAAVRRLVTSGSVACPWRGRVDVLECFSCPSARGLTAEHDERILCAWQDTGLPRTMEPRP